MTTFLVTRVSHWVAKGMVHTVHTLLADAMSEFLFLGSLTHGPRGGGRKPRAQSLPNLGRKCFQILGRDIAGARGVA